MSGFNDIGIARRLDWPRIAHLLRVGMAAAMALNVFGNRPWVNAVSCAWIGVGNLWMFGGLLAMLNRARRAEEGRES